MITQQYERQEALYQFPYHYLPHVDRDGVGRVSRSLGWGFEYLTYMTLIKERIDNISRAGGSLLDVGCGDGFLLNSLQPGLEKYGIDLSSRAIKFARAFSTDANFEVKSIQSVNRKFDVVSCIEVLEHIHDDEITPFVKAMLDCIEDGGHLVVSVPTTAVKLNKKHYRHYDEALLGSQLEALYPLRLVWEKRAYKVSAVATLAARLLNNKLWTVNAAPILRAHWRWHCKYNWIGTQDNGAHLIRVYEKCKT